MGQVTLRGVKNSHGAVEPQMTVTEHMGFAPMMAVVGSRERACGPQTMGLRPDPAWVLHIDLQRRLPT